MKIYNITDGSIPVSEMKLGQIGVITRWDHNEYLNLIIQRIRIKSINALVALGETDVVWHSPIPTSLNCRVRILEKGTLLEI